MIQRSRGSNAFETFRWVGDSCGRQECADRFVILILHRLDTCVGAEGADLAAHVDHRLVQRVAKAITRIAEFIMQGRADMYL